jgi:iron complex transport system substrate-binding protein
MSLIQKLIFFVLVSGMASVAHSSAAVSLTDAAGKPHVFDRLPERLVVVGAAPFIPLHMLYLFEESKDRLKGFEVKVKKSDEFLDLVDPEISLKQTLDSNPGPESVAALKPDLVITKSTVETGLSRSLKILGIPVLHVGAETPDMFLKDLENLGKVLGNMKRADEIIRYYQDKLSLIRERIGSPAPGEKPGILVLEYNNRGNTLSLNVPAMGWFQTQQALISGGNPVWLDSLTVRDGWQITGFEQVAAWNPDKIFLIVWYQLKGPEVVKGLYGDSKWSRLKAVQKKDLHLFPQDIYGWDSATPRWILGALWMAKMTYPDRFGPNASGQDASGQEVLDMRQTVKEFYRVLYGLDEAVIEKQLMPVLE